nr:MAG TPA: hypothetical protein [Caudoviricetes sp.]
MVRLSTCSPRACHALKATASRCLFSKQPPFLVRFNAP